MKPEKWYQRRLAKYFEEHYEQYEDTAEYFPDPFVNQWLFDIPERAVRVELTCTDKGEVKEQRYKMAKYADRVHDELARECEGLDAVYEDYIIRLVGEEGFEALRDAKILTSCGSINGRNLYTIN
jgi:hypothetical protein